MPRLTPLPVDIPAGLYLRDGKLASSGRWVDAEWVRFVRGRPEKIGGYQRYTTSTFLGLARDLHAWDDLDGKTFVGLGTTRKLYYVNASKEPADITPKAGTDSLTNAFSTTSGSSEVTVHFTAHGLVVGQYFHVDSAVTVGGLDLQAASPYTITSVTDADSFVITHTSAATSTVATTGSADVSWEVAPLIADPAGGFGWGAGGWGLSTWGTARASSPFTTEAGWWTISNFGKFMLAQQFGGFLSSFDPTASPVVRAARIAAASAPGAMRTHFVTSNRFVVAVGAAEDTGTDMDPMLVWWCAQGDYTIWTPTTTNNAGKRRLQHGKRLMGGSPFSGSLSLVWSDTTLYAMQFTGSRFVFDTRPLGFDCGLAGPHAFTVALGSAFWWGRQGFHMFSGAVRKIPRADEDGIEDYVRANARGGYETKAHCFYNVDFNEVWWEIVGVGETEPSFYVAVSLDDFSWTKGTLARNAAVRARAPGNRPLMAAEDGYLYEHEFGLDANGSAQDWHIESAAFQAAEGANDLDAEHFVPDMERQTGDITLDVYARNRPAGALLETDTTTFAADDEMADLRVSGRMLSFRLSQTGVTGGDFRLGRSQFLVKPSGGRR